MRARTASALLALVALAAPAIGEDVPPVQQLPAAPPASAVPSAVPAPAPAPAELPPPEPPVEVIEGATTQSSDGGNPTFDTMESIPFENAVEPPDEPPPLDNTASPPGLDNTAPGSPGAAPPGAVPAPPSAPVPVPPPAAVPPPIAPAVPPPGPGR